VPAAIDLSGQRFGRLLVIQRAPENSTLGKRRTQWLCRCDCGNDHIAATGDLRKGDTQSCGCLKRELDVSRNKRHGESGTKLHNIWKAMNRRCTDAKLSDYHYYGGRGIRVCNEWRDDYCTFRKWALSHGYQNGLTIDRIDTNGNYEPSNCRWVTHREQCNNRRSNRMFTHNGVSASIQQWSDRTGIPYSTLYMRLRNGWRFEDAISTFQQPNKTGRVL